MVTIQFGYNDIASYEKFLAVKRLPYYRFAGSRAIVPDEYAAMLGLAYASVKPAAYTPSKFLFDYQADIVRIALQKGKFSIFADCGLGKTMMFLEYIKHVSAMLPADKCILVVSPLMVVSQTLAEAARWYPDMTIDQVPSGKCESWLQAGGRIGITNYEAMHDMDRGRLGALILDESSMLKSHYGKWASSCLRLGRGLRWKLACTGTPAPNDRIEYANHAVFMDVCLTVNSFLARFFINRGQTCERWSLKQHALRPFYRALSHWCIFVSSPSVYNWKDNTEPLPPIHVNIEAVSLTDAQRDISQSLTGSLLVTAGTMGGIAKRSTIAQIAKGQYKGNAVATNKPAYIADMVHRWPDESTIIWCKYNAEQDALAAAMPEAASIDGTTPHPERVRIIDAFKVGTIRTLITKPKILGFGLNLQVATRQIFSTLQDSYEEYYQAVKRSNRFGATRPLNVHIPITDLERPMIETVLSKCKMVDDDTREQEKLFKEIGYAAC